MDWQTKKSRRLLQAILTLKTNSEAKRFFRDLMTRKEIEEFSNRFRAAEMLAANMPYVEIEQETGLSSTTVARVAKWLRGETSSSQLYPITERAVLMMELIFSKEASPLRDWRGFCSPAQKRGEYSSLNLKRRRSCEG